MSNEPTTQAGRDLLERVKPLTDPTFDMIDAHDAVLAIEAEARAEATTGLEQAVEARWHRRMSQRHAALPGIDYPPCDYPHDRFPDVFCANGEWHALEATRLDALVDAALGDKLEARA